MISFCDISYLKKILSAIIFFCAFLLILIVAFGVLLGVSGYIFLDPIIKNDPNWAEGPLGGLPLFPLFLINILFSTWLAYLIWSLALKNSKPRWPSFFWFVGTYFFTLSSLFYLGWRAGWLQPQW